MHQIEPIPAIFVIVSKPQRNIARKTGSMLLGARLETRISREKGLNDIVTEFDGAAERMIVGHLGQCFPEDRFFGEEMGSSKDEGAGGRWIIDPIDGTVNFTRGMPNYTISIAYEETQGEPVVGVVYNPVQAELYTAVVDCGAFLNEVPIHVSEIDRHKSPLPSPRCPIGPIRLSNPILPYWIAFFCRPGNSESRIGSFAYVLSCEWTRGCVL